MQLPYSLFTVIFTFLTVLTPTQAAFTVRVTSGNDTSTIEQNDASTWCYYPAPRKERTLLPGTDCEGDKADFRAVMATHLRQTASISYYSAALERLGGPEYLVNSVPGKVYLCYSGRATDGLYDTSCEVSTRDNQFGVGPFGNRTVCSVKASQETVTDACYAPGLPEPAAASGALSVVHQHTGLVLPPFAVYVVASLFATVPL